MVEIEINGRPMEVEDGRTDFAYGAYYSEERARRFAQQWIEEARARRIASDTVKP